MVEARELVKSWTTPWPGGSTVAACSALDVLLGDLLELEQRTRPETALVSLDGAWVEGDAIAPWTIGWPGSPGVFERLLHRRQGRLLRRLAEDDALAIERIAAWRRVESEQGNLPWSTMADMEVVSLAMGHYGPARQEVALPVIASFLVGVAAAFAGTSVDRIALAVPAARNVLSYEPPFAGIARTSSRAIEELARRSRAKGHDVPDPFARPIRSYLPLLGGTLV